MLCVFITTLIAQLCLTHGWDPEKIAPGPTDCVDEPLTFCGVTFLCKCIWAMPTFFGTMEGCGLSNIGLGDGEVHPILIQANNDNTLDTLKEGEASLWEEIEEDKEDEDKEESEDESPEDPDTEGCGVYKEFDQGGMLSLRPAKISGIRGSHYLPGNVEAILKIIHNRTGGKCKLLQRSIKKGCERSKLKPFKDMDPAELESQGDHTFAIRVGLKKNMRRTVVNAVGQAYQDKYSNLANPCRVTKKKREVICLL